MGFVGTVKKVFARKRYARRIGQVDVGSYGKKRHTAVTESRSAVLIIRRLIQGMTGRSEYAGRVRLRHCDIRPIINGKRLVVYVEDNENAFREVLRGS